MPGPVPTPTRVLEMRGSWRAKGREAEPPALPTRPACPQWLRPEAKRAWKVLAKQLEAMGILGEQDRNALARYCQTYAKWRAAEEFLQESGDVFVMRGKPETKGRKLGPVIGVKEYPQVQTAIRLGDQLLKLEREFGLTPSARAGLAAPKQADDAENRGKERFFKKTRAG